MDWWVFPLLFSIGVAVGVTNVLAGGGSLVSMPVLIFLGLDPAVANGTNRLAIAIQNIFAVTGFRRKGFGNIKFSLLLILPALPGVIAGTIVAVKISGDIFRLILSIVMIIMLPVILLRRKPQSRSDTEEFLDMRQRIMSMIFMAGIGFYSGFIQAGVGFLFIGAMVWTTTLNLVRVNAHKVFAIGVFTWISVVIFAISGQIQWTLALILSAGNALGGWLGSKAAVAGGEKWIKRVLTVAIILMALKLMSKEIVVLLQAVLDYFRS
ncbi:sulfite exporter TauE/SafE family protein [bacterium]|nr:sulfite exporter TauE/SafE family protein [candidate division CSSED10-310 bacterium]